MIRRNRMGSSQLDVVFWYPALNPYMADRWEALARRGRVSFEVWRSSLVDPSRSWELGEYSFPQKVIPSIGRGRRHVGFPFGELRRTRPRNVVTLHGQLPVALAPLINIVSDAKLYYYVEKTFDNQVKRHWSKELIKRLMFARADGFLTPGNDAVEFLGRYGVEPSRVKRLPHVMHDKHFARAIELRASPQVAERRRMMGLDDFVFLFVGRLSPMKGIDRLIEAFRSVRSRIPNASLLLVGDAADRSWIERTTAGIDGVVVHGFVQQEELPGIYALGNVFVFPTQADAYALVIDEALAAGLPVITTDHVAEVEARVKVGITGEVVQAEDVDGLAQAMLRFARDRTAHTAMSTAAAEQVAGNNPDYWASVVEELVST